MRRIAILVVLLVILGIVAIGCSQQPSQIINLPKVEPEKEIQEPVQVPEPVKEILLGIGEHTLGVYDSVNVLGKIVRINAIDRVSGVLVDVDGKEGYIVNTKDFEVINGLKVEVKSKDFSDNNNPKIVIAFDEFKLGSDEYLFFPDSPLSLNEKTLKLKEVGSDYAYIEVGPNAAQKVLLNTEKSFDGFSFKLLKTFYSDTSRQPHAWVQIK